MKQIKKNADLPGREVQVQKIILVGYRLYLYTYYLPFCKKSVSFALSRF